ncbi:MAG: hypothetical protein ISS35_07625 [Kiritimatiellae bacterium]|nr:hypothetical protein [Kiritimatiellia bacterium]
MNDNVTVLANISGFNANRLLASQIDEYRLGPQVLSEDWIRACWLSVASNNVFVSYETAENNRPGSLPIVDADGDGMLDAWEIEHFGSTNASAEADADDDGMNNGGEFIAGTDPTNAASVYMLSSQSGGGGVVIDFMALDAAPYGEGYSRWYSLERATNLLVPQWNGVPGYTNILGADQGVSYTSPAAPAQFFKGRVRLEE